MVNITVQNDSDSTLKTGFYILGMFHPSRFNNNLTPGDSWDAGDFPSFLPQSFEVRREDGAGFNNGETLGHIGQMAGAGAAGTAAVFAGTAGVLRFSGSNLAAAGVLWNVAGAAGAQYAREAEDSVKRVGLSVSWSNMTLVIRNGPDGIEVWCDERKL
ncbi:hypothetical protein DFH07DRAFT_1065118 [Mycena maculata]|uniref:Uncharacterized protein n=1 Tax=Mycena maculata TaxID=230809 RepID=A0AAD7I4T4_9AGAR|nr:hypothetical protein DFH07DRAFT_1065118 [Mycena maculata]